MGSEAVSQGKFFYNVLRGSCSENLKGKRGDYLTSAIIYLRKYYYPINAFLFCFYV